MQDMSDTPRHGLPMLSVGQAQKEVTHNEALLRIDRLLQPVAGSRSVSTPPPEPLPGDTYIVPVEASGAWTGFSNRLVTFDGFGWEFANPVRGSLVWIADEAQFSVFDDGWSADGWPVSALKIAGRQVLGVAPATVAEPSGGSVVDGEARAVLADLIAALRNQGIVN